VVRLPWYERIADAAGGALRAHAAADAATRQRRCRCRDVPMPMPMPMPWSIWRTG